MPLKHKQKPVRNVAGEGEGYNMEIGILSYGGYLPKTRLQKSVIAKAHRWFNPGLGGLGKGERTMANWDEDTVTMAVEAARDCMGGFDRRSLSAIYLASTSFPFLDRQNAGIVGDALDVNPDAMTLDISSSQRAGTSALMQALRSNGEGPVLVTAAEKRRTKAASPQELTYGDGAAALLVGEGDVIARCLGMVTEAVDFVDHFRSETSEFDYGWEERWIRDEGYMKIAPRVVRALFAKTGLGGGDITTFCFPTAARGVAGKLAKTLGIADAAAADNLQAVCGETGAAHPLVMLAHALDTAAPGDKILVVSFGQGCDALLFEVTPALKALPARRGIAGSLARRREETNYHRFLAFNDMVPMERGLRSEVDKMTGLSTHYRNKDMSQKLMGGECRECGTIQFPKTRVCVNPNCGATDTLDDHPFADKRAKINSFTIDRLTYSPDPPAWYGMVQFEGGGRLMNDFTDIAPDAELEVGMEMQMMFRVKDYDDNRGFRRYFWKATPVEDGTEKGV